MRGRRPEAMAWSPEMALPSIVKLVFGLKGGELLEPWGAGVTMVVNVDPTSPAADAGELLSLNMRGRPAADPVEQVPPRAPTAVSARPMKADRPFLVPQKVEVDEPETPLVTINWSPAIMAFGARTT